MNRIAAGSLLLVTLAACAPPRAGVAAGPSPVAGTLSVRQIPAEVSGLPQTESRKLEPASAGTLYRYGPGIIRPDVYVYPLGQTAGAAGPDPLAQAQAESRLFKEVLEIQRQQRQFDSYEILADSAVTAPLPGIRVRGWHVSARLLRGGDPRETHQHLFALGDQLVKVRTTFVPDPEPVRALETFVRELVRSMIAPAP